MSPISAQAFRPPSELWCWGARKAVPSCGCPWSWPLDWLPGFTLYPPHHAWWSGFLVKPGFPASLLGWTPAPPGPQGDAGPCSRLEKSWPGPQIPCLIAAVLGKALMGRIFVNRELLNLWISGFTTDFSHNAEDPEFCVIQSWKSNAQHMALFHRGAIHPCRRECKRCLFQWKPLFFVSQCPCFVQALSPKGFTLLQSDF